MADFELHIDLDGRVRPVGSPDAIASGAVRPSFSNMTGHGSATPHAFRWNPLLP
jgi:hypothetical protein